MSIRINLDWRCATAIGATIVGVIFAAKMTPESVEQVSTRLIDAVKSPSTIDANS